MQPQQELIDYCEKQFRWDDDLKQELYTKILELPDDSVINKGWCVQVYNNLRINNQRDEQRQAELRQDNAEQVVRNLGLGRAPSDPVQILSGQEDILIKLDSLSPLLRDTMIQHYVEGRSPEDIASSGNENVEAVRKRITRARNTLKGD